jgi:hypothetical protein
MPSSHLIELSRIVGWTLFVLCPALLVWGFAIAIATLVVEFPLGGRQRRQALSLSHPGPLLLESAIELGCVLALERVSALWYLTYREWTHTQSLSTLPLVPLLCPEGLLLPRGWKPTTPQILLLSGVLAVSSVAAVLAVAKVMSTLRNAYECLLKRTQRDPLT